MSLMIASRSLATSTGALLNGPWLSLHGFLRGLLEGEGDGWPTGEIRLHKRLGRGILMT